MAIEVKQVGPALGALVSGVDLAAGASREDAVTIKQALLDHQVLFFREQDLTGEQFLRFGEIFGKPYPHFFHRNLGGELQAVTELRNDGSRRRSGTADNKIAWHTDGGYFEYPTEMSLLTAKELPPSGGDTMFASMYAAYDTLHPALQRAAEELQALHSFYDPGQGALDFNIFRQDDPNARVDAGSAAGRAQPVVIVHPETGRKALNVNRLFTRRILNMPEHQARHLLDLLIEHCSNSPEFQVRFSWEPGSIAVWDNRCTLHYAVSDYSANRLMWRITIAGTQPLHAPNRAVGAEPIAALQ